MHRTRVIVACICIAAGLVWIGQGSGVLKGSSFMVGDPIWVWIGVVVVLVGAILGWLELRSRRT